MEQSKMSGVSRKDWPVGGEPALTKKEKTTQTKTKTKKQKQNPTTIESTYTGARVSAMLGSLGACVSITENWDMVHMSPILKVLWVKTETRHKRFLEWADENTTNFAENAHTDSWLHEQIK